MFSSVFRYEIRTNPSLYGTPPTTDLYGSPADCRDTTSHSTLWNSYAEVLPTIQSGDRCPVNQYFYSGFSALQVLLDYTKVKVRILIKHPHI